MGRGRTLLFCACLTLVPALAQAQDSAATAEEKVDRLEEPMYTPFIERYILDELKQIRTDMQGMRAEMIEKVVDRELEVADKSMSYASNTVTYFFYLILGASSLLVLVGWTSIRDIKTNIKTYSDQEVQRITAKYERRLQALEDELHKKSRRITETQAEIDQTNEIHSLWLRASQATSPQNKIAIYDEILTIRPEDTDALAYKADSLLAMEEAEWAKTLCDQILKADPESAHAFYQRACAHALLGMTEPALEDLESAIAINPALRGDAAEEVCFESITGNGEFQALIHPD